MKREFIVERQGKVFCLYAGLLDMAHARGLKSIQTELIQIPTEENKNVAIVKATVIMEKEGKAGEPPKQQIFTGLGDAAPNNVAAAMRNCLLRLAETRAKARALRDAVNIGVAALEELGELEEQHDVRSLGPEAGEPLPGVGMSQEERGHLLRERAIRREPSPKPIERGIGEMGSVMRKERGGFPSDGKLSEEQANAIRDLCRRQGRSVEEVVHERHNKSDIHQLSQAQAADLIRALLAQANPSTTSKILR